MRQQPNIPPPFLSFLPILQIRNRWAVLSIAMEHRLGTCPVGEASVGIAVSSPHRREALEAVAFAIDAIKANVPVWKKEFYADGSHHEGPDGSCVECAGAHAWKVNTEWQGGDGKISKKDLK